MTLWEACKTLATAADGLLPDAGDVMEAACDKLLPRKLEFIGDLASGITNAVAGNWSAVATDVVDLAGSDFAALKKSSGGSLDPSPPPKYEGSKANTAAAPARSSGPAAETASEASARTSAAATTTPSRAKGTASKAASKSASKSPSKSPSTPPKPKAGQSATAEKTDDKNVTGKGRETAAEFLKSFSSPEDLLKAIRTRGLPDEILDSPAGMMMLQEQVQHLHRVNQLLTQMMQAMHEMQMAIIRNVRAA